METPPLWLTTTALLGTVSFNVVVAGVRHRRRWRGNTDDTGDTGDAAALLLRTPTPPTPPTPTPPTPQTLGRGAVATLLALNAVVNRVIHSPVCARMFACGCESLWAGGWRHCNVHTRSAGHPRCPLCVLWLSKGNWWYHPLDSAPDQDGLPVLAMTLSSCWVLRGWLQRQQRRGCGGCGECGGGGGGGGKLRSAAALLAATAAASLAAYLLTFSAVGLAWQRWSGYPWFFPADAEVGTALLGAGGGGGGGGGDSSGLGLLASVVVGTAGGALWALFFAALLRWPWRYLWGDRADDDGGGGAKRMIAPHQVTASS